METLHLRRMRMSIEAMVILILVAWLVMRLDRKGK